MTVHIDVPLNRLKFGQEDGAGINARVAGRLDGIEALAANLHANGQIEDLIVKRFDEQFYSVSNGNRRLAAFHMIYGADSSQPIGCTLHDVDNKKAFEYSLTTAVTAQQLHPVDQYEGFAKLRDEEGKTEEEIARQYGMTEKEVRQALALGRLSPKIRDLWRKGVIKAETAKAFTLALDHKTQDKVFDKLNKDGNLWQNYIKKELGAGNTDQDVAELLGFIGAEVYRAAGGIVTEDLFGTSHIISDEALLKQMARQRLISTCDGLIEAGWAWAEIEADLPKGARFWPRSQPKSLNYLDGEKSRIEAARERIQSIEDQDVTTSEEADALIEKLEIEIEGIEAAVLERSFDAKKRKTLGCIVDVEDGRLAILYGIKRPAEATAAKDVGASKAEPAKPVRPETPAEADEEDISQALLHRLSVQLTKAAATALIQDEQLALSVLLAGIGCYSNCGVKVSISGLGSREGRGLLGAEDMKRALPLAQKLKPAERITLLTQAAANALDFQHTGHDHNDPGDGAGAIVNAIDAKAFNAAARGAFEAKDYFVGVSKMLNLKAIEEALGPDLARQQSKNTKPDIVAFAVENVPPTGWLPLQLRAKGYDGPPVARKALAAAKPVDRKKKPVRKAAPAKKAAKKTPAKKRKAS
jgi:ParB family chromosome partitioning protein